MARTVGPEGKKAVGMTSKHDKDRLLGLRYVLGERRFKIVLLRLKNRTTQKEIAAALGITQQAVCRQLATIRRMYPKLPI